MDAAIIPGMRGHSDRASGGPAKPVLPGSPAISVIMANYNGGRHIGAAVTSVLRQTEASLELIVADDGSSDDSLTRAREAAAGDSRLIVIEGRERNGAGAARNRALSIARGAWVAIVDSDDFIHPERLEGLVEAATRDDADIVADDLLVFHEDHSRPPRAHLQGHLAARPNWISAVDYVRSNMLYGRPSSLGYLKPLIRREVFGTAVYDESLGVAEDYDLVLRLLIAGARMRVYPELGYFYRKHSGSVSHRLTASHLDAMMAAHDGIDAAGSTALADALRRRRGSILSARAYGEIIDALKSRDLTAAFAAAWRRPSAVGLLRLPLAARLGRTRRSHRTQPGRVAMLSRQRVVGASNGSSVYLLGLVAAIVQAGFRVDFIGASPKLFGRWPVMRLRRETDVFASYAVRGGVRIGRLVFARDPRVAGRAALAAGGAVLARLGLPCPGWVRQAPYAVGAKAERADMLYVARRVARGVQAVFCDYCFLAPLAPYALEPSAPVVIVMHDLMSARVAGPDRSRTPPEVATLTHEDEYRLLGQADAVLAIQAEEGLQVRARLPHLRTLIAPCASLAGLRAEPGRDDSLLFVGSNTAPNVDGLIWFFEHCWPSIRAARPGATLSVCGSVARSVGAAPRGVRLLGVVRDLAPVYRRAGIVISPLFTGSGLKIKLVEALAAGKAVVGTTVTVKGVGSQVAGAMVLEDDAGRFASQVIALSGDRSRRLALGEAAVACARKHFSATACHGELLAFLRQGPARHASARGGTTSVVSGSLESGASAP